MLDRIFAITLLFGLLISDLTFRLVPSPVFSVVLIVVLAAMLPAFVLQTANKKFSKVPFSFLLGFAISGSIKWLLLS